jgi:predicted AAA+ superfamily ATPase
MRRCGKSSLLALLRQYLTSHEIPDDHIIDINLESFQYNGFDATRLYQHIASRIHNGERHYLLLDEVQIVPKWERAVNALHVDKNVDIYLTGSNAHLLSSQLATLLSGRHIEINVFPLSFDEFMHYTEESNQTIAFERYTRYGGLPPVVDQGTDQPLAHTVLSGIYDTILVRDISQYLQIRNPMVFNDVACYLADTSGSPTSITNIEHRLKSARRPTANETIERYISGLLDAFLFYRAPRINIKGGDYLQGLNKYYPTDLGIKNMLLGYPSGDFGFLLENVIFNELKIRGYEVQVGKIDNLEIDFVAARVRDDLTRERLFIQVSASIMDPATRQREFEPLSRLRDQSGNRMILTLDTLGLGTVDGIDVINALDWLRGAAEPRSRQMRSPVLSR